MARKVFISYSHKDLKHLEEIRRFLAPLERQGLIDAWDDTRLREGDDWAAAIDRALAEAAVAVLLVTQDFLASEFITRVELPPILAAKDRGELTVIPVFLRPSTVDRVEFAFATAADEERRVKLTAYQGFGTPGQELARLKKAERERTLTELAGRLTELVKPEPAPGPMPTPGPAVVVLSFRVVEEADGLSVTLSAPGFDPVTSALELDLSPASRLSEVIAKITGLPQKDDLMDVGSQLWTGLLSGEIESRFEQLCDAHEAGKPLFLLQLELGSPRLERLPWESLYDERLRTFLSCHSRWCVVRAPVDGRRDAPGARAPGPLAVLAVIPEGSGLSVDREWRNLNRAVDKLGAAIRLELLHGRVSPDRLARKLAESPWDVFHFIGHGEAEDDRVRIRLNDEAGADHWLDTETFGALFLDAPVRLAVLNCCSAAAPSPSRSLSGLGPILLRAGVPAVVAMRYEITDDVANHFSRSFYEELLQGAERGRVDRALTAARRSIFLNHNAGNVRGFVTPVLYLAGGGGLLEGLADVPAPEPAVPVGRDRVAPAITDPQLGRLSELVLKGRCVPIVGPSLYRACGQRSTTSAPGPWDLVRVLAQHCEYPNEHDLKLCEVGDDWLAEAVLQRVCQHFQHVKDLYDLVDVVRRTVSRSGLPPALLEIARWPLPGIVCTTFDGLMAQALRAQNRAARMVNYPDQETDVGEDLLLIHLRGTPEEQGSLVLTEDDHDQLWQRLSRLNSRIVELVAGFGRSMLLIGVSPQDALIRRFLYQLLPEGLSKRQGSLFFVCPEHSPVDDAYWTRYDTQWLEVPPDQVIQAVSAAVTGAPPE